MLDIGCESATHETAYTALSMTVGDLVLYFYIDSSGGPGTGHWVAEASPARTRPHPPGATVPVVGRRRCPVPTVADLLRFIYNAGQAVGRIDAGADLRNLTGAT